MKIFLPILLFAGSAMADVCSVERAPFCPTSGVRILDETYPVQAFVISQSPYAGSESGKALPRKAIIEFMRAYNFKPDSVPNILFPTQSNNIESFHSELINDLVAVGVSRSKAKALVKNVRNVEAPAFTWQQDYFESAFTPSTGRPQVQFSEVYARRGSILRMGVQGFADSGACQITAGPELRTSIPEENESQESLARDQIELGTLPTNKGEYGGNMEGLPGGLCLVGNNMTTRFATQICGPAENIVRAEVNWLQVGHVDEILKVVPDKRNISGRPAECAFTIFIADTVLGLSLLKAPGALNQPTLVRPDDSVKSNPYGADYQVFQRSFIDPPAMKLLCPIVNEDKVPASPGSGKGGSVIEASLNFLISPAMAQTKDPNLNCSQNFGRVTNVRFTEAIDRLPDLVQFNAKIQESLLRSRKTIYDAVLKRLPQCRPFFLNESDLFTAVPNYFSPPIPQSAGAHLLNGKLRDPGAMAQSLFPNPTNSVLANATLMYPGPGPDSYRQYLDRVTRNLNLSAVHLDTWDYAHAGRGNLHCSSHSLPYCRPAGAK